MKATSETMPGPSEGPVTEKQDVILIWKDITITICGVPIDGIESFIYDK